MLDKIKKLFLSYRYGGWLKRHARYGVGHRYHMGKKRARKGKIND